MKVTVGCGGTKAAFYKLSNKDEKKKHATATSAATNIFFQYHVSFYQCPREISP